MNRRALLSSLFGAGAALALDPEKALWTPGKKLISIPKRQLPFTTHWMKFEQNPTSPTYKLILDWEAPIGSSISVISKNSYLKGPGHRFHGLKYHGMDGTGSRQRTVIDLPYGFARPNVSFRVLHDSEFNKADNRESAILLNEKLKAAQRELGEPSPKWSGDSFSIENKELLKIYALHRE
jgi:hypothetical protein